MKSFAFLNKIGSGIHLLTGKSSHVPLLSTGASSNDVAAIGEVTGYRHPDYAYALSEFGTPFELPRSRGMLLRRPIPGSSLCDAMGSYPIFCCSEWSQLQSDLEDLSDDLVSVALVADPFGDHNEHLLQSCFPDVARPFKEHFVIDLTKPFRKYFSDHHRRNVKKAIAVLNVDRCEIPVNFLTEWDCLYSGLICRHGITGIAAFSQQSFARQLVVPGIEAFRAVWEDRTVGMLLCYVQGNIGYYHLGAYSPKGYELNASFALFERAITFFADVGLRWLDLGAGAGVEANTEDGLTRFKRGWASGTKKAYFCGRVLNRQAYSVLTAGCHITADNYFPSYRSPAMRPNVEH